MPLSFQAEQELKIAEMENDSPLWAANLRAGLFLVQNKINLAEEYFEKVFFEENSYYSKINALFNLNNLSVHRGRYQEILDRTERMKRSERRNHQKIMIPGGKK